LFFTNLETEMAKRGKTIKSLAKEMKLSKKSLENKLNGSKYFTISEIEYILNTFDDCSFKYLFETQEDPLKKNRRN